MNRPRINGKIVKTEPDSVYEDKVFDQFVWIELNDGSIIFVEDHKMLIVESMIGKIVKITISAFLPQIQKISEQHSVIESNISVNDKKQKSMHFEGRIEEFNESRDRFILNLGAGSIEVDIHPFQVEGFEPGNFVKFEVYRIDLNVLYPDN